MGLRTVPFCSMLLINQTELVRSKPNRARHLKFRIVIFDWFNWVVESWPFIIGPKCISLIPSHTYQRVVVFFLLSYLYKTTKNVLKQVEVSLEQKDLIPQSLNI